MARARSPALNEKVFRDAAALTEPGVQTMSLAGTVRACVALLVILTGAGAIGWNAIDPNPVSPDVPVWYWICIGGALVIAIATILRPRWAPWTAPLYAALEGAVVGGLSRIFEFEFEGIVLQAVLLTLGVFVIMLGLYASGIVKATENFRLGVISATGAIALVYLVDIGLRIFGSGVPYIHDTGPVGIAISVVIVLVAALNLVLDFDFIEKGADQRAPAHMNWYAAFGLLVTIVWLYLELLRLLAKARSK